MNERSNHTIGYAVAAALLAVFVFFPMKAVAQSTDSVQISNDRASVAFSTQVDLPGATTQAALNLPDAPGLGDSSSSTNAAPGYSASAPAPPEGRQAAVLPEASHTDKYIEPGQVAPTLTAGDKALLGVKDAFSLFSAVGWITSAGYEQLVNGSPNYGTDRGAFGQRIGASAIRDITEGVFSDSIMSPLLHEDPRYYRMGPGHNFFVRAAYAATRPILTRTDGGHTTVNLALLAGNLGGSALTNLYYPQVNRNATDTMETFGGSIGGSAIGDVVNEFLGDVIHLFHSDRH